jgi:hypothetical protein
VSAWNRAASTRNKATGPGLAARPGFVPYVYGAKSGRPSPCRPALVLEALAGGRPPERRQAPPREAARATGTEVAAACRCESCGYLETAIGHQLLCREEAA